MDKHLFMGYKENVRAWWGWLVVMGIEVIFKGHVLPHVSKGQIIMRGCLNYMSTMFEHGLQSTL